jgi:hypothetical protein
VAIAQNRTSASTPLSLSFEEQILPIFEARCAKCHSGISPQAGLDIRTQTGLLNGGTHGPAIVTGSPEKSLLYQRVRNGQMPLGGPSLSDAELELIRNWIELGVVTSRQSPTFGKIRRIFAERCYHCHGPDVHQSGLRLDSLAAILNGSTSGRVVIPGNSEKSRLTRRIAGLERPQMPYGSPPLSGDEIALVRDWIDQGAPGPDSMEPIVGTKPITHWAYVKPVRPELPKVKDVAWCRNPIDYFVMALLEQNSLSPSVEADKETLIRRLSLDLIGLPPTIQEVEAFLVDRNPSAYEAVVDRLLASPHYGERWARPWLDLARYADSNGFENDAPRVAWKFRDWVIDALNKDMPFKEFTIEQIAGDMLPNATTAQKIASGFHRNTLLNREGGTDPEEQQWLSSVDRVNTTATVWLGTTLQCAQCHNHKFDPFTQKDYYRFLAFFSTAKYDIRTEGQGDIWQHEPDLLLPTPEQETRRKELEAGITRLQGVLDTQTPELDSAQALWEAEMKAASTQWTVLRPNRFVSLGHATLKLLDDKSILVSGNNPEADTYVVESRTDLVPITGLRLEVLTDAGLPNGGPGRDPEGNFFLSDIELDVSPTDAKGVAQKIVFKEAIADESQPGYDVSNLVKKGPGRTAWAIDTSTEIGLEERQAVLLPEKSFGFNRGTMMSIRLKHNLRKSARNIGRFRLSVTSIPDPRSAVAIPARLRQVLKIPQGQRTEQQKKEMSVVFRSITNLLEAARAQKRVLEKSLADLGIVTALVMGEERSFERPCTNIRIRGSFLNKGDRVYAGVPESLNPLPEHVMPNRLGLAEWLVSEDNPLTARVTVNRFWETLFGRGIVETTEDLGTRGEPPTHPELLDWLATEFMRQQWSMKQVIRLIVTSSTYRQSSRVTPQSEQRDPYNKLLARAPRFRVEGEIVRDIALSVSGLLSPKIGGPSVFPYQPPGLWDRPYSKATWTTSKGEDRHRRGIYTFLRRTSPYPSLSVFDAPSREFCTVRRVRTNTPLQTLTTLNDPTFFEAAQALAHRIVEDAGPDATARATYGFRCVVTRRPTPQELDRLLAFWRMEVDRFQRDPKSAMDVVDDDSGTPSLSPELAAWTMVANVLLNLDETITKE